jgi:hypothetical protein
VYPVCMGKPPKDPWRWQTKIPFFQIQKSNNIATTGTCISADQFKLPAPSMITQTKGRPMTTYYKCGTVFVDHHSEMYVHFQKTTLAVEKIEVKVACKCWSEFNGVKL